LEKASDNQLAETFLNFSQSSNSISQKKINSFVRAKKTKRKRLICSSIQRLG